MKHTYDDVSIIIPAYNEELAITEVIDELYDQFPGVEIIVVDDCSTDNTVKKIDKTKCTTISHRSNQGYGAAIKTGVNKTKREVIAFFDGDGQFNPVDLENMIKIFRERTDIHAVLGKRIASSHKILSRSVGKFFLVKLANYLTRSKIPDLNCGMRVLKRKLFLRYQHIFPNGYSLSTTSTFVFLVRGYGVHFFPIQTKKRKGKSSVKFFRDGFNTFVLIIRLIAQFDPLRVFLPISLFLFLFSFSYSLWEVITKQGLGIPLFGAVAGIGGLIVFFMGILCDQVSAIRLERYESFDREDME